MPRPDLIPGPIAPEPPKAPPPDDGKMYHQDKYGNYVALTAEEEAEALDRRAQSQAEKAARDAEQDRRKSLKDSDEAKHVRTIAGGGTGAINAHVDAADDAEMKRLMKGLLKELGSRGSA